MDAFEPHGDHQRSHMRLLGNRVANRYAVVFTRVRVPVFARVRAPFFAAALRAAACFLRVAAAFFAAARRLAGPPLARSSRSATRRCRSAIRLVAVVDAREPCALFSASESSLATRLRRPFLRNLSNSASAWDLAI